ncbi:MAG: MGMT family protein [Candidatus Izemoplasmatales bacterium]|jgi:methylated-DNA-protein-cysteine methyltransferase-like protein
MTQFTIDVIETVKQIPKGKVMTYGQVAIWAGNPWGARQVVRILNSMSQKHDLPWHRVINAKGEIGLQGEGGLLQKALLQNEGISFKDNRVDLAAYRFEAGI